MVVTWRNLAVRDVQALPYRRLLLRHPANDGPGMRDSAKRRGAHRRGHRVGERHVAEYGGVGVLDLFGGRALLAVVAGEKLCGAVVFHRHQREPPAGPPGAEDPDVEIAVRK